MTPIAGIPLMVNSQTQVTDDNGQISVSMNFNHYYAISSGLSAVSFAPLYDRGANFMANGTNIIDATRLVTVAAPACRVDVGGVPHIFFSTYNSTDVAHTVSRLYKANRMYSATGGATPPDIFAPGTSGFTVPQSEFQQETTLNGIWDFLGQRVAVGSDIKQCADQGVPSDCQQISQTTIRVPIQHTRDTIVRLLTWTTAVVKSSKSKVGEGRVSSMMLARGASIIAAMQKAAPSTSRVTLYSCPSRPAPSCTQYSLTAYKAKAQREFGRFFARPMPKGFEGLLTKRAAETARFKKEALGQVPTSAWACPPSAFQQTK